MKERREIRRQPARSDDDTSKESMKEKAATKSNGSHGKYSNQFPRCAKKEIVKEKVATKSKGSRSKK